MTENSLLPFGLPYTTTHLHNAHTASESDGWPGDFTSPGTYWDHHYAMMLARNDPDEALASLWYHDHMLDFTATNVYAGLSAMALDEARTTGTFVNMTDSWARLESYGLRQCTRANAG